MTLPINALHSDTSLSIVTQSLKAPSTHIHQQLITLAVVVVHDNIHLCTYIALHSDTSFYIITQSLKVQFG